MSTFSEKLRILRKNREWTQDQLADALSVSESTVQKWEVDKNEPPVSEIKRLAEVFCLPVSYLVDDAIDIPEFYFLGSKPAETFWLRNAIPDEKPTWRTHVVVNPNAVKQTQELDDNSQSKNDNKDPKVIAKLVIEGRYAAPYTPDGVYADLRVMEINRKRLRRIFSEKEVILSRKGCALMQKYDIITLRTAVYLNNYYLAYCW